MDQLLHIHTGGIQADGKDTFHNHRYEPTPYEWIEQLYDNFFYRQLTPSSILAVEKDA